LNLRLRKDRVLWEPKIVEKLLRKHRIIPEEVEQVLFDDAPHIRRAGKER